tara:strand:+ start:336 stop:599 length:264 start_codon:yes stop_codon:yes gene_type:complete
MKVKIQQRSVYHKFAEIEIDVPDTLTTETIHDYLDTRLDIDTKIDVAMLKAEVEYGFGIECNKGMEEYGSESEWRFECEDLKTGGHL